MKSLLKILQISFLFLFMVFQSLEAKIPSIRIPKVRIKIAKSLRKLDITGTDISRHLVVKNDFKIFDGRKRIRFNCTNLFRKKSDKGRPILLASLSSPTGLLSLKKQKYVGNLHILTNRNSNSCDVVHETDLENYISPLLSKEMNGSWPVEALKAQAVAARTYAIHKMKTREVSKIIGHEAYYDLESSEKHQVSGTFFDITKKTRIASWETKGLILVTKKHSKITPMFFHAESGGDTYLPDEVWENYVSGYKSVKKPYKKSSINWDSKLTKIQMKEFIKWYAKKKNMKLSKLILFRERIVLVPDRIKNNNVRLYLGSRVFIVGKPMFRRFFGRRYFTSNRFTLKMKKNVFTVKGHGNGHGVGMSQIGAKRLAEKGWDYRKILVYYYPGHKLKKIY